MLQIDKYSSMDEDNRNLEQRFSEISAVREKATEYRDTIVDRLLDFSAPQLEFYAELVSNLFKLSTLVPKGDGIRPVSRKDMVQFREKVI